MYHYGLLKYYNSTFKKQENQYTHRLLGFTYTIQYNVAKFQKLVFLKNSYAETTKAILSICDMRWQDLRA
jgi:hypothetical protein